MSQKQIHVVFAEEDALFRLMEVGLRRALTPEGEKTLRYFFGDDFSAPLKDLTTMADRLELPPVIETTVCLSGEILDRMLPSADFVVVEASTLGKKQVEACGSKTRLIQQFGRSYGNIDVATARKLNIPVANLARLSSQSSADHITALILALARNLMAAHRSVVGRRDPAAAPVRGRGRSPQWPDAARLLGQHRRYARDNHRQSRHRRRRLRLARRRLGAGR